MTPSPATLVRAASMAFAGESFLSIPNTTPSRTRGAPSRARRLSTTPGSQRATWAYDDDVLEAAVVPALIGAWNAGADADRDALALLADTDYEQVERAVSRLRNREDPPVWSIGKYRGVCSRIDALFSVAPAVTTKNLDDFFFLAEYILSERDPKLDLPAESRWKAAVYGKVRNHSDALRTGIRDTLILIF